jgi:hypothetical protein
MTKIANTVLMSTNFHNFTFDQKNTPIYFFDEGVAREIVKHQKLSTVSSGSVISSLGASIEASILV